MRGEAGGGLRRRFGLGCRRGVGRLGILVLAAEADQARHAVDRAGGLLSRLGVRLVRREQAAEQAAGLRGLRRFGDGHLGRRGHAAVRVRRGRRAPATATELASSGMRGGRTVAGMVPGGVCTNSASCGATPIWLFFTAAMKTGFMPPSANVLIGAVGTPRRLSSAICCSSACSLSFTALAISAGTSNAGHLPAGAERQRASVRRLGVEHVALLADVDLGLELGHLEMVVALLQHLPERDVRVVAMLGEILRRHLERIGLHLERFLAAEEGVAAERVDFRDLFVGHRVAAARRAVAVHHELRAGAAVGAVEGVRIAEIERQIILRVRIHLAGGDVVEALRRLAVAFLDLRTEFARPAADRIGLQQREPAVAVLLPDLELGLFLEQPDQDRRVLVHVLGLDVLDHLLGERLRRLLAHRQDAEAVGVAARQCERRHAKRGRSQEGTDERASDQTQTPPEAAGSPRAIWPFYPQKGERPQDRRPENQGPD